MRWQDFKADRAANLRAPVDTSAVDAAIAAILTTTNERHHMPTQTQTRTLTILRIDRLPSSRNGNPRFRFTFTDGSAANLQSDAGYGYEVGNPGHREGDTLEFTFSRRGTVEYARPV